MASDLIRTQTKSCKWDTIFERFNNFNEKDAFIDAFRRLCCERSDSLISNKITSCDAKFDKSFSRATCHTKATIEELYPFGSIFGRGVEALNAISQKERQMAIDDETKTLVEPLLTYLFDEKSHECLRKIASSASCETELTVTLAAHFFSKLSISNSYEINNFFSKRESTCHCGEEKNVRKLFDDTSIGHRDVWHGALDILLDSSEISVHLTPKLDDGQGGETSMDVKFQDIGSVLTRDQVLAQTITFSFLQKQRHPLMKHFLIPCVLASKKEVQFFFYDSKNDILLESRDFEFFLGGDELLLSYQTIIAGWFVLNYKHLCSGPTKNILKAPKADFPKFVGSLLELYKSRLRFRNVDEERYVNNPWDLIQDGRLDCLPFRWPEEPFARQPYSLN